jgi:hypothetical protein
VAPGLPGGRFGLESNKRARESRDLAQTLSNFSSISLQDSDHMDRDQTPGIGAAGGAGGGAGATGGAGRPGGPGGAAGGAGGAGAAGGAGGTAGGTGEAEGVTGMRVHSGSSLAQEEGLEHAGASAGTGAGVGVGVGGELPSRSATGRSLAKRPPSKQHKGMP